MSSQKKKTSSKHFLSIERNTEKLCNLFSCSPDSVADTPQRFSLNKFNAIITRIIELWIQSNHRNESSNLSYPIAHLPAIRRQIFPEFRQVAGQVARASARRLNRSSDSP